MGYISHSKRSANGRRKVVEDASMKAPPQQSMGAQTEQRRKPPGRHLADLVV
jgi:hypothetical protein